MPFFDLSLEELQSYAPPRPEPADFDAFWGQTLDEARQHPLNAQFEPADYGLKTLESFDVSFAGYGGQPVKGWLLLPRHREGPLPCVVQYIGYGGGRGFPLDWLDFSSAGFAHLVMDTRGQGSAWRAGDTPDIPDGANPYHPGFMTQGILDPHTYYYRRVYTDAVRAIDAARTHSAVDESRVAVTGTSQGGGISIAVAGLDDGVNVTMPDVPFLCHFQRAAEITPRPPYTEIANYCKVHRDKVAQVFGTLGYFDGMNFAGRGKAQALFSVALMDDICPPSTVYAAYNHYVGPKDITVYTYNNHEGGETHQRVRQIRLLQEMWL